MIGWQRVIGQPGGSCQNRDPQCLINVVERGEDIVALQHFARREFSKEPSRGDHPHLLMRLGRSNPNQLAQRGEIHVALSDQMYAMRVDRFVGRALLQGR